MRILVIIEISINNNTQNYIIGQLLPPITRSLQLAKYQCFCNFDLKHEQHACNLQYNLICSIICCEGQIK
jgi:hypothetical protein